MMAYMLYRQNKEEQIKEQDINDAVNNILKRVQEQREIADPNKGFIDNLCQYVKELNNY
jgi:hypothetical protein